MFSFAKNSEEVNLIIEQGNTYTKVGIYHNGQLYTSSKHKTLDDAVISRLFSRYELKQGIFSSVAETDPKLISVLKERLDPFFVMGKTLRLPVQVGYETPETLGQDRLAAVVGANYLQPDKDILVIDAGTAITYELVEASGLYVGGNISPGLTTRFEALHEHTSKLPLVSEQENIPLIATNTVSAIQAGVVNGIVYEMIGYIEVLRLKYPNLLVFLTGGHSFYFERRLKNIIFADINLVMTGLNRILEYNVEN